MEARYPRNEAVGVAQDIGRALQPACERICVAGSLRRGKATVGDVELVYIPRSELQVDRNDFFAQTLVNLADEIITKLEESGILGRRGNSKGSEVFGPKNKLMVHRRSSIPVDLFATRPECWFNYLVCRTGPAESNVAIARAAKRQGWHWNPYGAGFFRDGHIEEMHSEADVFKFVGFLWPNNRVEIPL